MPFIAEAHAGFIQGLGPVEVINVPVAIGATSIPVLFGEVHTAIPGVFISSPYAAGEFVTAVTRTGFTLNFTAPLVAQTFQALVIGA